ncbi:MAG: coenzyme F420-0:L-glutamate ligase [Christensenellaceae bacterium]|nr:coenzyme F420-0:L-glutamate ligase [Christensenellaceae bacterium]
MKRTVGVVARGIRTPIVREGDDLVKITADSLLEAAEEEKIVFADKDVLAITESVVARAQGNYVTVDDISEDIKNKMGSDTFGVIFPILSRNRFAILLKGMARAAKKIYLMLSYPSDEVGNHLFDEDLLEEAGIDPWSDVLDEKAYRDAFGFAVHPFTGVDYVAYYKSLIEENGCEAEVIFANKPEAILNYTKYVINCDIHTRVRTKRRLVKNGAENVLSLDDILNAPLNGGCNEKYGLLGSNKATEETVKLFPRDCETFVNALAALLKERTGKNIEVMVYGDGAFKDPVGKIWELADPVVSPAYTAGLEGTPNEIKIKYVADNDFANLSGDELTEAVKGSIAKKDADLKGSMLSQGTTPRRLTDLIGSLSDLTSGSGDKGTPVVFIQGYFDNFTSK